MATFEEMYTLDRIGLLATVLQLLSEPSETPGGIAIVAFLARKGEILPLLRLLETPLTSRIRLAKYGVQVDADLDQQLADDLLKSDDHQLRHNLLEILSQAPVRSQTLLRLTPLLRDRNARTQSKIALLLARAEPEGEWIAEGLNDPDPRVRANIVEALWSHASEFARQTFARTASDPHHRVSANAIYGLYRLGDQSALRRIRQLLAGSGLERRSGLWLAERTADPRYLPILGKLIGKVEPEARQRCLRVIQAAKARREKAIAKGQISIEVARREPRHARLCLTDSEGRRLPHFHPFDLIPAAAGQPIDDFELERRQIAPMRTVVLLIGDCPDWGAGWRDSIPSATPLGAADRFGFLHFDSAAVVEPGPTAADEGSFKMLGVEVTAEEAAPVAAAPKVRKASIHWAGKAISALRRAFDSRPSHRPSLDAALRLVAAEATAETHVVILQQAQEWPAIQPPAGLEIDVVATHHHAENAQACKKSGGLFLRLDDRDDIGARVQELSVGWRADYDLRYTATEGELDQLEIVAETGYGRWELRAANWESR